ncbi:hypothetical protein SETIT_5G049100v2 [Setaria italica]|uniref:Uncharacterized protein n=2 Tax=Setaria TaxID=4554 RepID=A0A368R1B1_SETIT|nr:hypothetical protein SETIT_5G049100v2 [Setaria italica]TKW12628.1 hypothetical protein SEVIR_5G048500v2 [Setaria viridis]
MSTPSWPTRRKGLIRDVLPPGSVGPSTNGRPRKRTWAQPFDPSRTITAPFHLADGTTAAVPFMTTTSPFEQQQVAVFPGPASRLSSCHTGTTSRQRPPRHAVLPFLHAAPSPGRRGSLEITDLFDKAVSTPGFIRKHTPAAKVPVGRFMVPKFSGHGRLSVCLSGSVGPPPVDFVADRPFLFAVVEEWAGAVLFFG